MVATGLETRDENVANPSTSATTSTPAAQNPAHTPETDPLAAFVASLTPDQKAKFVALLVGGKSAR